MSQIELFLLCFHGLTLSLLGRSSIICDRETLIQTFARILGLTLLSREVHLVCVHNCAWLCARFLLPTWGCLVLLVLLKAMGSRWV